MAEATVIKMEKDWSQITDQTIIDTTALSKALDQLNVLEKQTRTSADLSSNSKVLLHIVRLCYSAKDYKQLAEQIASLSKKRALLKQAVTKMIQECIIFVGEISDEKIKLDLIDSLLIVTAGKIFVEVERARLTKTLAAVREKEGKINEAADLLQELQVETFGSMERREKTDFILEQMRLCLARKDYIRTVIISRKINLKFFEDVANSDLKVRFYNIMIEHAGYEDNFLGACKFYRQLYNTVSVKENPEQLKNVLLHVMMFIILSPYDSEQSDLINRINLDVSQEDHVNPQINELLKCFITPELMRWTKINEIYGPMLKSSAIFNPATEQGSKRYKNLHERIVEHNIRVISKYYSKITMKKVSSLVDLPTNETEKFISNLVVNKTIFARIDRLAGIVNFEKKSDPDSVLNDWSQNINSLLDLVVKTTHLIAKEEMLHSIVKPITE